MYEESRGCEGSELTVCFPFCRVLMTNINEELDSDDLKSVKFLLSCKLSREKLEKAKVKQKSENRRLAFVFILSDLHPHGGVVFIQTMLQPVVRKCHLSCHSPRFCCVTGFPGHYC